MPSLASASAAVLCGILWILDVLLSVFVGLYRHVKVQHDIPGEICLIDVWQLHLEAADGSERPHVVIVGGSFAGLWCTRHLENDFRVTVVDYKDYFEYTPGCLRLLVDETHVDNITAPILHPHSTARLLQGEMMAVQPALNTISIRTPNGDKVFPPTKQMYRRCCCLHNDNNARHFTDHLDIHNKYCILLPGGGGL